MAILPEVTAVSPAGVKVNVKLPAVPVITRSVKVATPLTAATVVVPERTPVPVAMLATTLTVELVTVLPPPSTMRITGCVPSAAPLAAPTGWVVIAAAVGAPVMSMLPEVTAMKPGAVNVSVRTPVVPVIERSVNVATPLPSVVAVSVPPKVPPPEAIAAVTTTSAWLTALPEASRSWIAGCWANAAPFTAEVEGWVVIVRLRTSYRMMTMPEPPAAPLTLTWPPPPPPPPRPFVPDVGSGEVTFPLPPPPDPPVPPTPLFAPPPPPPA